MRRIAVLVIVAAVIVAGGCSGGSGAKSSEPWPMAQPVAQTRASLAQQYLEAVGPVNTAAAQTNTSLGRLGNDPAAADVAAAVKPYVDAIDQAEVSLRYIDWPANLAGDAHAVIQTSAGLAGALGSASNQNVFTAAAWESQVSAAQLQSAAAANTLRHDLGLPPVSS